MEEEEERGEDEGNGEKGASGGLSKGQKEGEASQVNLSRHALFSRLQPILLAVWLETSSNVFDIQGHSSRRGDAGGGEETLALVMKLLKLLAYEDEPVVDEEVEDENIREDDFSIEEMTRDEGPSESNVPDKAIKSIRPKGVWAEKESHRMMQRLSLYFPYTLGDGTRGEGVNPRQTQALQEANVAFCELAAGYVRSQRSSGTKEQPSWVARVKEYILRLFNGETRDEGQRIEEDGGGGKEGQVVSPLQLLDHAKPKLTHSLSSSPPLGYFPESSLS